MREIHETVLVPHPVATRLSDDVVRHGTDTPDRVILARRVGDAWTGVTAGEFLADVRRVAKGLVASGVQVGDRVGLMSRTRFEWTLVDYAVWFAGGVTVPIYETSSAEQVEWILSDSGAVAVVYESERHVAQHAEIAERLAPDLRVVVMDRGDLDGLRTAGDAVSDEELEARRTAVAATDLATIIYTSGTTGRPKGCSLSHLSFAFEAENIVASVPEIFADPDCSTLLFLPLAHVFGRIIQIACISAGVRLGHSPDVKNLLPDLAEFRPTFLLAVPRVFEKIFNSSRQRAIEGGKGPIFVRAASVAIAYSEGQDGGGPGLWLTAQHALFDRLVYSKLRDAMGGQVRWAVSGGAPLGARLGHFFRGIGVTILEGYGLTETAGATTVNRPELLRIGSVGRPFPGAAVKIADDGEILLAGPHIFDGYWNNPTASAEVLEADGWFHTGDLGALDDDGYLAITGRKKELLVTAGGKNVAPAVLEDRLRSHWIVSQCMVVGDSRPYIAALVTIDPESFPMWKAEHSKVEDATIADLVDDPELRNSVQHAVDDANKAVSQAESIRRFRILTHDWTEDGGQLTPSMKLKRAVVMTEHATDVEALYT
jgi:long-chain acyl-CoA synthetase